MPTLPDNPAKAYGASADEVVEAISLAEHAAIGRMWGHRGRVTYDLNEHFASELYRSTSERMPGSVFDHLTHINPLVVLPDPWPIHDGLVRGFYIFGLRQDTRRMQLWPCYTDERERQNLGLLFVVDLVDPETGEIRQQTHVTMHVPTSREQFTLQDAVSFSMAREETPNLQATVSSVFTQLMRPALSVLLYLCCDNRDMVEPRHLDLTSAHRQRKQRDRDPFFVEVGYRIGPRLHGVRRATGRVLPGQGIPSGVEQAPHQRSGHFRQVRFGPKLASSTTKWINPYWVRLDLLSDTEDPINMVVPVEEQRRDPLRRRGLLR
ncbi:hypothetical protein [Streptomyces sp. NPDC059761]|uniref:hypothetical protein n=1 Tax=Streptomyces sp. NPDC059761 TaxID=3346937 RepID=UPI00365D7D58